MIGTHRGCLSTNNLNVVCWQQIGQTRVKRIKSENVGMRKISEFIESSILKLSANATLRRINSICPIKCCGRQLFDDEILLKHICGRDDSNRIIPNAQRLPSDNHQQVMKN